ncbi:MAG: C-terminal helicase domain-containing protein, partial [Thermoanaerobaculia bacterium]
AALDGCISAAEACIDAKADILRALIADAGKPLIVYTAAIATARSLYRSLAADCRVGLVTSKDVALRTSPVREVALVFDALSRGDLDVVITTDLGAEGLNLQVAGAVVHYDVPWNPVRLDQRNGRAHRIGQRREAVRAVYFVPEQHDERDVLRAVASKNRIRRGLLEDEREYARNEAVDRAVLARGSHEERLALLVEGSGEVALFLVRFGGRLLLVGERQGRLLDSEVALLALVDDRRARGVTMPLDTVDVSAARDRIERYFRSRLLLPGSIPPAAPQCILASRVDGAVRGVDMAPALRRAYRAGPTLLLQEIASEYLDATRALELRAALDADRPPDVLPATRAEIVAALITVKSLRDAIGERRMRTIDGFEGMLRGFYLGATNCGRPPSPSLTAAYA